MTGVSVMLLKIPKFKSTSNEYLHALINSDLMGSGGTWWVRFEPAALGIFEIFSLTPLFSAEKAEALPLILSNNP